MTEHVARADTAMGSGISTFMGADHVPAHPEALRAAGARAAFLGVPYEGTSPYRYGQSAAPGAVRDASHQFFSYHYDYDVDLFEEYRWVDCGDVAPRPADPPASHDAIRGSVRAILEGGALPLIQGGDHSIPIGTMRGLSEFLGDKRMGLIQFDCHLDSSDEAFGTRITGASHLRRTSELPNVDPRNMVHIGSRGLWNLPDQKQYCDQAGIHVFRMREVRQRGIEAVVRDALAIAGDGTDAVALDVDLDVLDCSHAPGVCSPEPGGLTAAQLLEGLDILGASRQISLVEVVELVPIFDPSGLGARMACYVFFTILGAAAAARLAEHNPSQGEAKG